MKNKPINWAILAIISWLMALTVMGVGTGNMLRWFDDRISNIEAAK
jgi:hypothetical protein